MDALTELAGSGNKVDIRLVRYILKQQDIIIKELQNEVKFLNLHTEILNKQIGQLSEIELHPKHKERVSCRLLKETKLINKQMQTSLLTSHLKMDHLVQVFLNLEI
mgnify:CR=1 FL=1